MERDKKVLISFTKEEYEAVKRLCKPGQPFSTFVREQALQKKEGEGLNDEIVHRLRRDIGRVVDIMYPNLEELTEMSREAATSVKVINEKVNRLDHLGENRLKELLKKQEELMNKQKANLYWIVSGVSVLILLSILTFISF